MPANTQSTSSFFGLKKGYRFLCGPKNALLYDHNQGRVIRIFEPMARWLQNCLKNGSLPMDVPASWLEWLGEASWVAWNQDDAETDFTMRAEAPLQKRMVWIELTKQCNYRCTHCYAESGPECHDTLPDQKLFELIDEVGQGGWPVLQLTGGDPTAHPRFMEFVRRAHKQPIDVVEVYTNASALRTDWLREMKQLGTHLAVSFYADSAEIYEQITQSPGSFDRAVRVLRQIVDLEIPVRLALVLMPINEDREIQTRSFLESIGIKPNKIGADHVRPSGRGRTENTDMGFVGLDQLTKAAAQPSDESDFPWAMQYLPTSFSPAKNGQGRYNSCWEGELVVASDGSLYPCIFSRNRALGSVIDDSLTNQISKGVFDQAWAATLGQSDGCSVCEFRYACFDCRALTESVTGAASSKPPGCRYDPVTGVFSGKKGVQDYFDPERIFRLAATVTCAESALMDSRTGALYDCNEMARAIALSLDGSLSVSGLIEVIHTAYPDRSVASIAQDVGDYIMDLAQAGLLEQKDSGMTVVENPCI